MTPDHDDRRTRKARTLLTPAVEPQTGTWADLGCGEGVFTRLLTKLLAPDSTVYAVDRDPAALRALAQTLADIQTGVTVHTLKADFTLPLDLPPLDGMLLANSLHFVRDKEPVLQHLVSLLRPGGRLVVIEYNTRQGNYAVPFPLPEEDFLRLAATAGLGEAVILVRAPSSFLGEMYTGVALKNRAKRCRAIAGGI